MFLFSGLLFAVIKPEKANFELTGDTLIGSVVGLTGKVGANCNALNVNAIAIAITIAAATKRSLGDNNNNHRFFWIWICVFAIVNKRDWFLLLDACQRRLSVR